MSATKKKDRKKTTRKRPTLGEQLAAAKREIVELVGHLRAAALEVQTIQQVEEEQRRLKEEFKDRIPALDAQIVALRRDVDQKDRELGEEKARLRATTDQLRWAFEEVLEKLDGNI